MTINREHGFLAIVLRELDKIFSRFMYIVLLFLVPVFCFVFFATLMPSGLPMNLELGIVDMDNSVVSRKMIRHQNSARMRRDVHSDCASFCFPAGQPSASCCPWSLWSWLPLPESSYRDPPEVPACDEDCRSRLFPAHPHRTFLPADM